MKWLVAAVGGLVVLTVTGLAVLAQPGLGSAAHEATETPTDLARSEPCSGSGGSSWSRSSAGMDPAPASPPRPEAPSCPLDEVVFDQTVDLLPLFDGHNVVLLAFQAKEDLSYVAKADQDMTFVHHGTICESHALIGKAPVDALRAAAEGKDVPEPASGSWGGGGGGGSGGGGSIAVGGHEIRPSGGSTGSMGSGSHMAHTMSAGEWIMFQAGLTGVDPAAFDEDDSWTFSLQANGTMEAATLDSVPFYCGMGFTSLQDALVSSPTLQVGGRLGFDSYAATVTVSDFATQGSLGKGRVMVPGASFDLDPTTCFSKTSWARGEVAIEVDHWQGPAPYWTMSGAWTPSNLLMDWC